MFKKILVAFLFWQIGIFANAQIYGAEIVHWDFTDGITDDWENESSSGISHWEYRGPETSPDNTVCSLGSCGSASEPIESISASNGFVIFDSNYWDDDEGPCGPGLGSGQDPAPHNAWLVTPTVDLSNNENIVLTFQQQYKHFQTETSVLISVDGGENYETIFMNPTTQSAVSDVVEWVSVNITSIAAGESDVRFKFLFTQTYYWWLLDDIVLYEPNENDLLLGDAKYTTFDFNQEPNGFGDMEYNAYPSLLLPQLNFSILASNIGGFTQTGVQLSVEIEKDGSEEVFAELTDTISIEAGNSAPLSLGGNYTPNSGTGYYDINFELVQEQEDEGPLDNFADLDFNITDYEYARDEGPMEDQYELPTIYSEEHYLIGNLFESKSGGHQWHSIGVALGDSTTVGTSIYGAIYNLGLDTLYAITDEYIVNEWDLNDIDEEKIIHIPFQESLISEEDMIYAVLVGHEGGSEEKMRVSRSGEPPAQTTVLKFPDANNLFYLLKTPVVRQFVFEVDDIPGCMDSTAMNYDEQADTEDGSCRYPGCTNEMADNYDSDANWEDGSCVIPGCMDTEADNFNANATLDDGTCEYWGCTDSNANNYDSTANVNDGSCTYDVAFMIVSDTTGCLPFTITVFNQTNTFPEGICEYTMGDGSEYTGCEESFEHEYTEAGEYTITYTYTISENESNFEIGPIMVYPVPEDPVISYNQEENLLSCTSCDGAVVYNWFMGSELIDIETDSFHPDENENYYLVIYDEHGCSAESNEELVIITSIDELNLENDFIVYPNPAKEIVWLHSRGNSGLFRLYDVHGQEIFQQTLRESELISVDVTNISAGIYFYSFDNNELLSSGKLLITK